MAKCKTCFGFGIWAIGDPSPVGPIDAADGVPTKACPECGSGNPSWKTADGKIIPINKLTDDHLVNIIDHIKSREKILKQKEPKLLKSMKDEQIRRISITRSIDGRTNTRKWGSRKKDKTEDQHNKKKKWATHEGTKRTKLRWNKKKGIREKSKKGSRDKIYWSD
jgi:hypothetical protein